ncbi:FUSC family protein [Novosphingobium lindaniclasticum]
MTKRFGLDAALFSVKAYMASMLAIYIALSIGLERPYWAFLTSYIVAQPLAGAVVSKAMFRVIGTFIGAGMAVIMVPVLVNAPELLTIAIGAWLALCVFVSLLDRTPRSYAFVLAGYTAVLIVLPSVDVPGTIFTVATLRVQEITIGILCGSFVHALVLPRSVSAFMLQRVANILADAERWSSDSLLLDGDPAIDKERQRLALDVTELHQLSIHLPYESTRIAPRIRTVRALQDQLSLIMPLGAAVTDRIGQLRAAGSISAEVESLLADTRHWFSRLDAMPLGERESAATALQERSCALEPRVGPDASWDELILLSLLSRLASLIGAHRDCRLLAEQLSTPSTRPISPRASELVEGRRGRELHRDFGGATRGAIGAFFTICIGCALWIGSGWHEGATAVMLAGVFTALFAAAPDPLAPLRAFFLGTLIATLIGLLYGFVIMPRLDGFLEYALAMAPMLLMLGTLMQSPRWGGIALPMLLGLGSPVLVSDQYVGGFAGFVNGALAQLVGIIYAIVVIRLLNSTGSHAAIRSTVRAGWADIAERANLMSPPDVRAWINRMLDRIALLAPRLAMAGRSPGQPLYDALRDLRTGVAIGELRELRLALPPTRRGPLTEVLQKVGEYYRGLDPDRPAPADPILLEDIDIAMTAVLNDQDPELSRAGALGLVSLRRNLFPASSPTPKALAA